MILETETIQKYDFNPQVLSGNKMKVCIAKCDFCGDVFEKQLYYILRGRKKILKDACTKKDCINRKQSEIYASHDQQAINEKRNQTNLERYGFENSFQNPEFQEKQKQTMIEKYGVEKPLQLKEIKEKQQQTMLERYGTLSSLDASGRKEDIIQALKDKADETTRKGKETCLEKYGVDNIQKIPEISERTQKTLLERHGENFFSDIGKKNANHTRKSFSEIIAICLSKNYQPLFEEKDYTNKSNILKIKCIKHDRSFYSRVCYLLTEFNQCPRCRNYKTSKQEKEIADFISSFYLGEIIRNNRELVGKELDIFIPEKNIAIEHNGLRWHSELHRSKNSHKNKFELCEKKGIQLFQIFGDEWRDKKTICKSMILNMLKLSPIKLNARELILREENMFRGNQFLKQNHLMGTFNVSKANIQKCFSLVDENNEIVCCFIARPFFSKDKEIKNKKYLEIVRFGTKINTNVRGGFSRLLKHMILWAKEQGFENVVTYSDCRYSLGNVYRKNGFQLVRKTKTNYYYTDDIDRFTKYRFRAKNGKSESEIVQNLGLVKIFDAGKYRWELKI